ncbi:retrovirus-related pol polyprotein from transposon TNT 1-94 [Tanacetum coccineum]
MSKAKATSRFRLTSKGQMLLMQAQESGAVLDEEQLLFLAGEQVTNVDDDVDDSPENDLALNVDHVFEADEVNTSTEASGSKPRSNTKKNRILPAKTENKKKVEDHPRTNKPSSTYDGVSSKLKNFVEKVHRPVNLEKQESFFPTDQKSENTIWSFHTLHMDLCGPIRVQSIKGKKYILVIVDDYSRFTWVKFLRSKDETPEFVINFLKQIQLGLNKTVRFIRTDNGTEFVNQVMSEYYEGVGIFHQKSVPRTPQQNGVVERRNRTLVEAARTMMIFSKAPMFLWAEAVATALFGALCYPTNDSEDLGKFQAKADIGIFVGYAPSRKGYRIYNKRTHRLMETIHVTFDEMHQSMAPVRIIQHQEIAEEPIHEDTPINHDVLHPSHNLVTGDPGSAQSSSGNVNSAEPNQLASDALWCCFRTELSKDEPKNFKMAVIEDCWFQAMQDEIHEFDRLEVWELVPRPIYVMVIALKWKVFDFEDSFAQGAGIRGHQNINCQCETKNMIHLPDGCQTAFLNGDLQEEVFISQPDRLKTWISFATFYRMKKALYGLKQAPRAWYDTLSKFLLANNFFKGPVDPTYLKETINHGVFGIEKTPNMSLTALQYAGIIRDSQDSRRSTVGEGAQFLGDRLHSRSKHIDIRHHFIQEQVENRVVELYFVETNYQLADILTKALPRERFKFLLPHLGMKSLTPETLKRLQEGEDE